jgi:hypothetical protein
MAFSLRGLFYHQYRRVALCLFEAARGTRLTEYGSHSSDSELYGTILSGTCLIDIYHKDRFILSQSFLHFSGLL